MSFEMDTNYENDVDNRTHSTDVSEIAEDEFPVRPFEKGTASASRRKDAGEEHDKEVARKSQVDDDALVAAWAKLSFCWKTSDRRVSRKWLKERRAHLRRVDHRKQVKHRLPAIKRDYDTSLLNASALQKRFPACSTSVIEIWDTCTEAKRQQRER